MVAMIVCSRIVVTVSMVHVLILGMMYASERNRNSATYRTHQRILDIARSGNVVVMNEWIKEHGAEIVNAAVDSYRLTPLMGAAAFGHTPMVALLLEHSAQVNQQDSFFGTALSHAVFFQSYDTCALLIAQKADVHQVGLERTDRHLIDSAERIYEQYNKKFRKKYPHKVVEAKKIVEVLRNAWRAKTASSNTHKVLK